MALHGAHGEVPQSIGMLSRRASGCYPAEHRDAIPQVYAIQSLSQRTCPVHVSACVSFNIQIQRSQQLWHLLLR